MWEDGAGTLKLFTAVINNAVPQFINVNHFRPSLTFVNKTCWHFTKAEVIKGDKATRMWY